MGIRLSTNVRRNIFQRRYYSDRGQCAKCYLSCKTCSGPRRDQCVTCPRGWQLAAGECHPECPEGFFKSNFGCQKCHHYCRTCKGILETRTCSGLFRHSNMQVTRVCITGEGPMECTSCPPHSMLEGGLCMECLGAQYYDPLTQLCKNCNSDCRRCTGPGKFSCAACSPPLHLDKLNNQCVPCCTGNEKGAQAEECCLCDPETGENDYDFITRINE